MKRFASVPTLVVFAFTLTAILTGCEQGDASVAGTSGTFVPPAGVGTGTGVGTTGVANLNYDVTQGLFDVAAVVDGATDANHTVYVYSQDASASFQTFDQAQPTLMAQNDNGRYFFSDYNHDGTYDLVALKPNFGGAMEIHIYAGHTNANPGAVCDHAAYCKALWETATAFSAPQSATDRTLVYLMGNLAGQTGEADFFAINRYNGILSVAPRSGNYLSGSQIQTPILDPNNEYGFQMADMNGDGASDLILIHRANTTSGKVEISVLLAPTFTSGPISNLPVPINTSDVNSFVDFRFADFNGDGFPDMFVINKNGTIDGGMQILIYAGTNINSTPFQTLLAPQISTEFGPLSANYNIALRHR